MENDNLNTKIREQNQVINEMRIKYMNLEQEYKDMKDNLEKVNKYNDKYENKITNLGQDLNEIQNKYNDLSNQYMILSDNYNKLLSEKSRINQEEIMEIKKNEIIIKDNNFTLNQDNMGNISDNKINIKEHDDLLERTSETENISINKEIKENNIVRKEYIQTNIAIKNFDY